MRLINTTTGLLEDFIGDDIPEYAILSHTWEQDEISMQEFQYLTDPEFANDPKTLLGKAKAGFIKIRGCVQLTASKGIQYVWVDTCCIDKTSSADLSESINSMYQWYANSKVCFAYLVDVKANDGMNRRETLTRPPRRVDHPPWMESRWFTRGWTLQELVAPPEVEFYSHSWKFLSTKKSSSWHIRNLTGIKMEVLETNNLSSASVAQKMSWASRRKTTRKEDMAYCLLGLFDVNMPLLYGEGEKAFLRLQEYIAASSTDHSLFAWGMDSGRVDVTGDAMRSYRSIFARSPAEFGTCGKLEETVIIHPDAWTETNRGLHGVFPTIPAVVAKQLFSKSGGLPNYIDDKDYLVILNCRWCYYDLRKQTFMDRDLVHHVVGIWISLIDARVDGKHGFCRVTDSSSLQLQKDVCKLLNTSPDRFQKDLWLTTRSRMIQVPRDHFSKRLGGFLIPTPDAPDTILFKIHSVYGRHVSGKMDVISCPLLPLSTSGGLVGMVTVTNVMAVETAAIIFGYPPSSTKRAVKFITYCNDKTNHKEPLDDALRRFVEADDHDDQDYENHDFELWGINLSICTVFHEDMIFTELAIEVYTWEK